MMLMMIMQAIILTKPVVLLSFAPTFIFYILHLSFSQSAPHFLGDIWYLQSKLAKQIGEYETSSCIWCIWTGVKHKSSPAVYITLIIVTMATASWWRRRVKSHVESEVNIRRSFRWNQRRRQHQKHLRQHLQPHRQETTDNHVQVGSCYISANVFLPYEPVRIRGDQSDFWAILFYRDI